MVEEALVVVFVGVVIALSMVGIIGAYAARYKRVPPGHAMVVYGRRFAGGRGYVVILGGGKFIMPIIESFKFLSFEPFEIDLLVEDVVSNVLGPDRDVRRLQVSVEAQAMISQDPERLQQSAAQLLHKTHDEIKRIVEKTIEGHTRGVLATEPRPEMNLEKVAEKIRGPADADLANLGIEVRSLLLKIRDTAAMRGTPDTALDSLVRELQQLDIRMRHVEEKLGISASGSLP